jgi:lipid-A-disaccharide synthase
MSDILIIAGEASGDTLGAGFVDEFIKIKPGYNFFGFGGDKMTKAGVELIYHIKDLAIFGFWEVVKNIRFIKQVERDLLAEVDKRKPTLAVLIDYPGFNLRLAPKLKSRGIKVFYYISPQIWAWGAKRINKIKANVDFMAVIFEFEKDLYEKAGVPVRWVGHPLLDVIKVDSTAEQFYKNYNFKNDNNLIGLFPGSRAQEIKRILPEMLYALELISIGYPRVKGIIGAAPAIDDSFYESIIAQSKNDDSRPLKDKVLLHRGSNYDLMAHAKVNLVCSGTATLECAMIGTPFVVVYKTSPITYMIARNLIRIPVIGMVNVVAGKKIVPELIQKECNAKNMAAHILNYLNDPNYYSEVRTNLAVIKPKLGESGASRRAAEAAAELIG